MFSRRINVLLYMIVLHARFEVFTQMKIQVVFWAVMPDSVAVGSQCFREPFCLHGGSKVL
jgi:hypothetical protein